jgi:hypothetical protein
VLVRLLVGHTPLHETIARELSETAVCHESSPIVGGIPRRTVGHGPLRPGDLAPSVDGLASQFDPTAHTVLLFGGRGSLGARLEQNFGRRVRIVRVDDPHGRIGARYGAAEGLVAIVRPDRYLAYLGDPDDVEGAERTLALAIG